ncbi:MAG: peptide ABC transporter substrate-binding protein, partial [Ktedonobacteraceae bacterium]
MQSLRKFRAQFLITFLALASMVILSACGSGSGTTNTGKAPASQQIYRSPLTGGDISTFDPAQVTDLASASAIDMVFTGLVAMNDKLQVTPRLAHDWTHSADGLTWTFHLRPNLKFSDGSSLTSADVAYSIDRALSPAIYSADGISLTYLGLIKGASDRANGKISTVIGDGIQTPDDNTVVIHVSQVSGYFLQTLSYPTSYVVEKSVVTKWGDKWTDHLADNGGDGGDGPFKVQKYDHNTGITFVSNAHYEGSQPQLREVTFPFIKDTETNYKEYQTNQVDNSSVPTADLPIAQKLTGHQFHKVPLLAINYLGLNYLVKPFDNIKIRQALELSLNRDVIEQSIYANQNIPTNHIVPSGMYGYNPNLTGPAGVNATSGDVNKAKQLFQEGMQAEGLTLATFPIIKFTYGAPSTNNEKLVTTAIQM